MKSIGPVDSYSLETSEINTVSKPKQKELSFSQKNQNYPFNKESHVIHVPSTFSILVIAYYGVWFSTPVTIASILDDSTPPNLHPMPTFSTSAGCNVPFMWLNMEVWVGWSLRQLHVRVCVL